MESDLGAPWKQFIRVIRADGTEKLYGPYWYAQYRDAYGRRRKKYLGKVGPADLLQLDLEIGTIYPYPAAGAAGDGEQAQEVEK